MTDRKNDGSGGYLGGSDSYDQEKLDYELFDENISYSKSMLEECLGNRIIILNDYYYKGSHRRHGAVELVYKTIIFGVFYCDISMLHSVKFIAFPDVLNNETFFQKAKNGNGVIRIANREFTKKIEPTIEFLKSMLPEKYIKYYGFNKIRLPWKKGFDKYIDYSIYSDYQRKAIIPMKNYEIELERLSRIFENYFKERIIIKNKEIVEESIHGSGVAIEIKLYKCFNLKLLLDKDYMLKSMYIKNIISITAGTVMESKAVYQKDFSKDEVIEEYCRELDNHLRLLLTDEYLQRYNWL